MAALSPPSPISPRSPITTPQQSFTEDTAQLSSIDLLEEALLKGEREQVLELLKTGIDLNESPSLLQKASTAGDIINFYFLLEYGARPSSDFMGTPFQNGLVSIYTQAHHSLLERHLAIFDFLTQFKAEKHPTLRGDYEAHQELCKEMEKFPYRQKRAREATVKEPSSRIPSSSRALF